MSYNIIWSDFAEIQLDEIYEYYLVTHKLKSATQTAHLFFAKAKITKKPVPFFREVVFFQR